MQAVVLSIFIFSNILISNILFSGEIIFLDGIPASGKSTLAQELIKKLPQSKLLSSDDLAMEQANGDWKKAQWEDAVWQTLNKAEELAKQGDIVVVDSFIIETKKFLDRIEALKKQIKFSIVLLYAPLDVILTRFATREGITLTDERREILIERFNEKYSTSSITPFDIFIDSSTLSPKEIADKVINEMLKKVQIFFLKLTNFSSSLYC